MITSITEVSTSTLYLSSNTFACDLNSSTSLKQLYFLIVLEDIILNAHYDTIFNYLQFHPITFYSQSSPNSIDLL